MLGKSMRTGPEPAIADAAEGTLHLSILGLWLVSAWSRTPQEESYQTGDLT